MMALSRTFAAHCSSWALSHTHCTQIEARAFGEWATLQATAGRITQRTEFLAAWAGWRQWCTELHTMVTA